MAWEYISQVHGVENVLYDTADRPEFLHMIVGRYSDLVHDILDQLEEKGLLGYDRTEVHCSAAYTNELPAPGFDPAKPRAKDNWTAGLAQVFSCVSGRMHREFDLEYAVRWFSRFGLGYYGCCDPLDRKMDDVRILPNVRKVSMSSWVNVDLGAEAVSGDYVFSNKPSPAYLASPVWQPEVAEADLKKTLAACKRYNCPLEFILKDVSTVLYKPENLFEWERTAMRVVNS